MWLAAASRRRSCCAAGRIVTAVASRCVSRARAALRRASRLVASASLRQRQRRALQRRACAPQRPPTLTRNLSVQARLVWRPCLLLSVAQSMPLANRL